MPEMYIHTWGIDMAHIYLQSLKMDSRIIRIQAYSTLQSRLHSAAHLSLYLCG